MNGPLSGRLPRKIRNCGRPGLVLGEIVRAKHLEDLDEIRSFAGSPYPFDAMHELGEPAGMTAQVEHLG